MSSTGESTRVVNVLGQDLRVRIRPGGDGATPVVLCCGIGVGFDVLQTFVDALDPAIEVVRFDVPGVGGSPAGPVPYGFPGNAYLAVRMLRQLGYSQADVLGLSWGGGLAQQMAFQCPRFVRRLVLVSTGTGSIMVPGRLRVLAKMATTRRFTDPHYAASIIGDIYGGSARTHPDRVLGLLGDDMRPASRIGYLHQLLAGAGWTSLPWLPLIRQQTLILAGDDEPIVPALNAKVMRRLLPHATLHIYHGGHVAIVTDTAQVAPLVTTTSPASAPSPEEQLRTHALESAGRRRCRSASRRIRLLKADDVPDLGVGCVERRVHTVGDEEEPNPTLDAADMAVVTQLGATRRVQEGEFLYREGDVSYDFFVLVGAEVDIVVTVDGNETVIARHGPGRFLGELNMLSGLRVFVSARVVTAGDVVVVSRDQLRQLMATKPRLGTTILAAFVARRGLLMTGAAPTIRVIGSQFSPESLHIREFLVRTRVPHEWLDADHDPQVEALLGQFGIAATELPFVIATGTVLRRATPGDLAGYLGLTVDSLPERCFDLIVVGGGPAGLAAAVYGASEGLRTLGVEMTAPGGQAGMSSRIENYLGFPMGISGEELTQRAIIQAEKFGASLTVPCTVVSLGHRAGHLVARLSDGSEVAGRAVIAATGASYRRLEASRLSEFDGNGVYYAATEMEARMCGPSPVVVVGGGNSAGQAAIFLSQGGCGVTLIIRGPDLTKDMSRYLVERVEADPNITLRTRTTVAALEGDETLRAVHLEGPDGEIVLPCAGLFSFIGADPSSGWLNGCAALDDRGFVLTDLSLTPDQLGQAWQALARSPLPFETSHPGLFAVGDLRSGSTKRVAAAVGEGSASVRSVHQYLAFGPPPA